MKKRIMLLAAGIAVVLIIAGGCSQTKETKSSTGKSTEKQAAESVAEEPGENMTGEGLIEVLTEEAPESVVLPEEMTGDEAIPMIIQTESSESTDSAKVSENPEGDGSTEGAGSETEEEAARGEGAPADNGSAGAFRIWGEITGSDAGSITVDNQSGLSSPGEMILKIDPESTLVIDAGTGLPVEPADASEGLFVAYPGPAMTMSIPPQTTPEVVLVNVQEDVPAPVYMTADGPVHEEDGEKVLSSADGDRFVLTDETSISPYLTRNIVTAEDIAEGSRCLVWSQEDKRANQIMLFAN